jgi:hypothetical protein
MWNELLKKSKRFPMSDEQSSRLQALLKRYEEWKAEREEKSKSLFTIYGPVVGRVSAPPYPSASSVR